MHQKLSSVGAWLGNISPKQLFLEEGIEKSCKKYGNIGWRLFAKHVGRWTGFYGWWGISRGKWVFQSCSSQEISSEFFLVGRRSRRHSANLLRSRCFKTVFGRLCLIWTLFSTEMGMEWGFYDIFSRLMSLWQNLLWRNFLYKQNIRKFNLTFVIYRIQSDLILAKNVSARMKNMLYVIVVRYVISCKKTLR